MTLAVTQTFKGKLKSCNFPAKNYSLVKAKLLYGIRLYRSMPVRIHSLFERRNVLVDVFRACHVSYAFLFVML